MVEWKKELAEQQMGKAEVKKEDLLKEVAEGLWCWVDLTALAAS
jgi:hypothetical protein